MTCIRFVCASPPCIGVASIFSALRRRAILSHPCLVPQNMIAIPGVSFLRQCTRRDTLSPDGTKNDFSVSKCVSTCVFVCMTAGSFMCRLTIDRNFGDSVALNRIVWRCFGVDCMILSTSSMNPMSSILSASSRTKNLTVDNLTPLCIMSSSRPGVATTTSAVLMACSCEPMPTPPNTGIILSDVYFAKPRIASLTCTHSSLVGVNMSACMPCPGFMCETIGRPNAAVFPDPVCDCPITSFPWNSKGMVFCWMDVGLLYPSSLSAFSIFAGNFSSENVICSCLPYSRKYTSE